MLDKTLKLVSQIPAGSYVSDEIECYDEAEIKELARVLNALIYAPSSLRRKLQDLGITLCPAHFYSEIPTIREIERAASQPPINYDLCFDNALMLQKLDQLMPFSEEFDPPVERSDHIGFAWRGGPFSYSDAMAYYCFVRQAKPRTVLEVGSGWSTLIADAAIRANGSGQIICVEPFPAPFLESIPSVARILRQPVQELEAEFFNATLDRGDILFIDSTHTVKHSSDCLHLYLNILPAIQNDIFVHAHDIHLPRAMPIGYLRDQQLYWTEQYLLYAYLLANRRTEVLFGSAYHFLHNRERLKDFMHQRFQEGGASLWFAQLGLSSIGKD